MTAHPIRLRGPWECEPLERYDDGPLPPPCRSTVPSRWRETFEPGFRGRVRYMRRFNRPTGLGANHSVWLLIDAVSGRADVLLNEQMLGQVIGAIGGEFDVTDMLEAANQLALEVEGPDDEQAPAGPTGEVRLEIRQRVE